ncbi:MAG: hypothetical protein ABI333_30515 [bacterium]
MTCVRGYEVRVQCGDLRTSGPLCLLRDDGEATCGHRTCTPDDIARDSWCDGSALMDCRHGVLESMDCRSTPGQQACDDSQTYPGCIEVLGEACDRDTFVAHCDGSEVVECGGAETRYDCSLMAHHSICVEIAEVPFCDAPEATTPCVTTCLGDELRFCAYDVSVDVDCTTFGQVCDGSGDTPTCR